MMSAIPGWFVILMGIGVVFISLICIVILCKILGLFFYKRVETPLEYHPSQKLSEVPNFIDRNEVVAAIGAAVAEENGVDVKAIRICSIKKI